MNKHISLLVLVLAFLPVHLNAATVFKEGEVISIKMFSDVVTFFVEGLGPACTSGQARVAIQKDDPVFSVAVATALTAKTTGATVQIGYHQQCTHNANSWDFESLWLY